MIEYFWALSSLKFTLCTMTCCCRRRFLEVTEAILASILMAALLVAVLGMPIGDACCMNIGIAPPDLTRMFISDAHAGAIYLVLKAAAYFIRAVLSLPIISGVLVSIRDRIIT